MGDLLEVLGSKKRLMILRSLSRGNRCVSELMDELKMDGKTAKYHLDKLERLGIVSSYIEGKRKYYQLMKEVVIVISPPPNRKFVVAALEKQPSEISL
ncbi:metalloregulator ArsR/SmtB family transcription factor [Geoglobus acetivorans]|uniref:Winged helix-turn-helix domain-containing protein n=1 Tax=Geoglobus acetivorans TaxID=565033 RepID=A0ABZ3H285_GEOAI|nr:winged helix-turn-helix transcriptional regulator [Geoglobus acetivorans]